MRERQLKTDTDETSDSKMVRFLVGVCFVGRLEGAMGLVFIGIVLCLRVYIHFVMLCIASTKVSSNQLVNLNTLSV